MKPFQLVVLGIFGFFAVVGVIVFATFRGGGSGEGQIPVSVWGTMPSEVIRQTLNEYNTNTEEKITLLYTEFRPEDFDQRLVEALAENRGPDVVFLSQDAILQHQAKIFPIPFDSFPERDFKDTFIELGELYIADDGILGLPFSVDPIVLYWNRDQFANVGRSLPPKTWEELIKVVGEITDRDEENNILKSAIALGEFQNVNHAKKILAMLFMQAGDPIIARRPNGEFAVTLGERFGYPEIPSESALRFYTDFADPVRPLYSWNRSFPTSKDAFLAGDVALYLGLASEAEEISLRNPNLNFDVTIVPQIAGTEIRKTFGSMNALSLVRASSNTSAAFRAIILMTGQDFLNEFAIASGLPPVRRDMLAVEAPSAYTKTFYQSALIADAFLDPRSVETSGVFKRMVEDVTAGREGVGQSITRAREALGVLLR